MIGNIYIRGEIGEGYFSLIDVIDQVKNLGEVESYDVYISSIGGSVETGFDIYDYLRSLKKPIKTIGVSEVMSIATVIYLAGDTRVLRQNTEFMIHLPWTMGIGTAEELNEISDFVKEAENRIVNFYTKQLNQPKEAIYPLLKNETFLTEEQCMSLGFVTEKTIKVAAKAYTIKNANKMSEITEKDKNLFKAFSEKLDAALKFMTTQQKVKVNAKDIQDANGVTITFPDLADDATPSVGDMAEVDGAAAEGDYVIPMGDDSSVTYMFTAGELTEIVENMPEEDEEMMKLQEENAEQKQQIEDLSAKLEDSEKANSETMAKLKELQDSFEQIKNRVSKDLDINSKGKQETTKAKNTKTRRFFKDEHYND